MWRWVYAIRARLQALVGSARSDRDLNDELSFHVAMQTHANQARGMSAAEAERRARLALDGVQQLKEWLGEQRSIPWFDHLRQDVSYATRTIRRTKMVSAAVIATFALGIGANAAIFSLINGVLLSPLPYSAPERIVAVEPFWTNVGRTNPTSSAPDFRDWRDQNSVLEFLAYHTGGEFTALVNGAPMFASIQLVTTDFFNVFGVVPEAGCVWTEPDRNTPVAVVSHAWAIAGFGSAQAAVGKAIGVAGRSAEILGVAPAGFTYPGTTDMWMPNNLIPETPSRGGHNYFVVGKLKTGVSLGSAAGHALHRRSARARVSGEPLQVRRCDTPVGQADEPNSYDVVAAVCRRRRGPLIACVNVAHLQLVRAAARTREVAVRCAIGAAPSRIMR